MLKQRSSRRRSAAASILGLTVLLAAPAAVAAEEPPGMRQSVREVKLAVDGLIYTSASGEPGPYLNADGRTMVPASLLARAMGVPEGGISWDNQAKQAVISDAAHTVVIRLNEAMLQVDGETVQMDTTATLRSGRIFLPARYIAEGLGGSAAWDAYNGIVYIHTAGNRDAAMAPDEAEHELDGLEAKVLAALADEEMQTLAKYVHPEKGVRFTPYSYIDATADVRLMPAELEDALGDPQSRVWGAFDGSGEPIAMDFGAYYERFVYPLDYREADQTSYNKQLFSGNALNNVRTVYPGAIVVEYHFDGQNAQYGGLDWHSLRLVFESYEGEWKLVGLINDEWTI
ncbi:copper amine oxidase N-terminal domain-containing protein [Paenibacillus sp. IB182496]|uniref:Copper amine oxidase N-terminal domain-containing protein n=1 Tax=Paenibacillus sabuli TaxID=2772509 RepID=A0A927BS57_9BACL|nr:copper amine oxidase N-terminal domain-containing protein [Paenibacillus sabuli]MBD2845788.1 copper amine oxidase N-terminal domain-containing protein [Paenibacillus sabuli]